MTPIRKQILDIIFWVALIVGIIMVVWRIFGNSPSDLMIITPFILMSIIKTWSVSNELKNFRYHVKLSFNKVRENINRVENKIDNLKNKK